MRTADTLGVVDISPRHSLQVRVSQRIEQAGREGPLLAR